MEVKDMTLTDVEARLAELDNLVAASGSEEEIKQMRDEMEELSVRGAELKDMETRKADAKALEEGKVSEKVTKIEERKGERKMVDVKEFRNSKEYIEAFAEFVKTGKAEEVRALLTENVGEAGSIAVPDFVYNEIKTAWDRNEIMNLVRRESVPGNLKVQFEISGTDAVVHDEGSGAVSEETLVEGIVTLIPKYIKKWISVSDEAMSLRGEAFLNYIYRELSHKIIKKSADELVGKIVALPSSATATTPSAKAETLAPAVGTVAAAIGDLSDDAANPVIIMNKATWSAFKAEQYKNNYAVDPFEGLPVRYNNSLPAYSTANTNDVYAIVGDLGYGALANFPNGEEIEFTFDQYSKKKEDLVEVLGKMYGVAEPVACGAFVLLKKPASL